MKYKTAILDKLRMSLESRYLHREFSYKGINGVSEWVDVIKEVFYIHKTNVEVDIFIRSSNNVRYSTNEIVINKSSKEYNLLIDNSKIKVSCPSYITEEKDIIDYAIDLRYLRWDDIYNDIKIEYL